MVGGFGSEEQGCKPEGRMNTASLGAWYYSPYMTFLGCQSITVFLR